MRSLLRWGRSFSPLRSLMSDCERCQIGFSSGVYVVRLIALRLCVVCVPFVPVSTSAEADAPFRVSVARVSRWRLSVYSCIGLWEIGVTFGFKFAAAVLFDEHQRLHKCQQQCENQRALRIAYRQM